MLNAGVPQSVIQLVTACNAKVAAERPQGFAPIIADLERMIGELSGATQAASQPASEAPRKARTPLLMAALVATLVIGMIGAYFAFKPTAAPKAAELAGTISTPAGDMVLVPAGEFRFGQFKQVASLPAFYIDRTEVSNAAYNRFCQATKRPLPEGFPGSQPSYPVVNVTIRDAREFARWAGKRLPTALEWEKAARGSDGRIFPWGNDKGASRANTGTDKLEPVDSFPASASPYGALNMVGNAWELVDTPRTAPTNPDLLKMMKPRPGEAWFMIRGQSAWVPLADAAIWDSTAVPEGWKEASVGFRCAKDAK